MTESPTSPGRPTRVAIRIESRSGQQRIVQEAKGDLYAKGDRVYIRYPEMAPEYGRTMTTVKLEPASIAILRQGDVRSDQTFVAGQRRIGYYETAQGKLELAVRTIRVRSTLNANGSGLPGTVDLHYELEVAGEPAGVYTVKLTIREEQSR